jgi:hypothetical protein
MKKLLCTLALLLLPATAELPPLSQPERQANATHVLVGTLASVSVKAQLVRPGFVNNNYTGVLRVTRVDKGAGVKVGDKLRILWWDSAVRPHGWAGPGGQYDSPKKGSKGKFYLAKEEGRYSLLLPNGWDPL